LLNAESNVSASSVIATEYKASSSALSSREQG
jgi:hypothetical protein